MSYKEKYGRYEVRCEYDGLCKWFKNLDKAEAFFKKLSDDLECDLADTDDDEVVILEDLRTGEVLSRCEIN